MKSIFEAKTIIKAQMQPNQAQGGQESPKRLGRAFSLPYFSYNLHYTKFIQSKISPSLSCFAGNFLSDGRSDSCQRMTAKSAPFPVLCTDAGCAFIIL